MKYTGIVTLKINNNEYVVHNEGSDYLFETILDYLINGCSSARGGFLNNFDIGYIEGGVFNSILTIKPTVHASRIEGRSIIIEGEVIGANLIIADYSGKSFYIRTLESENGNYLAQVQMNGDMLSYFQEELTSTVQVLIQWKLSFDN